MKEKKNKWVKEIDPEILSKFKNYFYTETNLKDLRESARKYSGSYNIMIDSEFKISIEDGKGTIKFIYYTNPNNMTNASYLRWSGTVNKIRLDGNCTIQSNQLFVNEVIELIKPKIESTYYDRKRQLFKEFNIA